MSQSLGEVPFRGPSTEWSNTERGHRQDSKAAKMNFHFIHQILWSLPSVPDIRLDPEVTGTER